MVSLAHCDQKVINMWKLSPFWKRVICVDSIFDGGVAVHGGDKVIVGWFGRQVEGGLIGQAGLDGEVIEVAHGIVVGQAVEVDWDSGTGWVDKVGWSSLVGGVDRGWVDVAGWGVAIREVGV